MKIDECIAQLQAGEQALESAPQKGFVDLDAIKKSITQTREFLIRLSPTLELGEKLIEDIRGNLLAKLNALKSSGGGALVSQAEDYIKSGDLSYEKLKTLQAEIEKSLALTFGAYSRSKKNQAITINDPSRKAEDYR